MIMNLFKTNSELEQYARETKQCVHFMKLLWEGVYVDYGVQAPEIPKLVTLTAHPVDFNVLESVYSPWEKKVMEALDRGGGGGNKSNRESTDTYIQCTFI